MALPGRDLPLQKLHVPWQQTHSVGAGLFNLGNTGFVNSVLQCLTHTAPLASYMLSRQHSQSCVQQGFCMMCTLQAHVHEVLSCSGSAVSPEGVISQLPRIGQHFQLGNQEDAHEFFYYAMDAMQRACLSRDSDWNTSQASRVIDQVFTGFLQSRVTCLSCEAVSDTYESYRDIPVAVVESSSVHQALKGFVTAELLDGYRCGQCKQLTRVAKKLTIHHCPNILTLCLKRFDPFSGRKINSVVKYPAYLHLGAYMSEAPEIPLIYSLYAVLVHQGHSCYEGHYYCFVKASNGRWYKMDDESVVPCDTKTVLSQQAYLLFYTRCYRPLIGRRLLRKGRTVSAPSNKRKVGSHHLSIRVGGNRCRGREQSQRPTEHAQPTKSSRKKKTQKVKRRSERRRMPIPKNANHQT